MKEADYKELLRSKDCNKDFEYSTLLVEHSLSASRMKPLVDVHSWLQIESTRAVAI